MCLKFGWLCPVLPGEEWLAIRCTNSCPPTLYVIWMVIHSNPNFTSPEIGSPTGLCWRRKLARWQSHTTSEPQTPPDELEPARSEAKLRRVLVEPVSLNQHKAKHLTRLYNRAINKPPGEHSFAVYCGSDHLTKIKLMLPMLFPKFTKISTSWPSHKIHSKGAGLESPRSRI